MGDDRTLEREIGVALELATPQHAAWAALLPTAKLSLAYKRGLATRIANFTEDIANKAAISKEELGERLATGGPLSDAYLVAGNQSLRHGDPVARETLADLVAAALLDDAKICSVDYILRRTEKLEATHIRMFYYFAAHTHLQSRELRRIPPASPSELDELVLRKKVQEEERRRAEAVKEEEDARERGVAIPPSDDSHVRRDDDDDSFLYDRAREEFLGARQLELKDFVKRSMLEKAQVEEVIAKELLRELSQAALVADEPSGENSLLSIMSYTMSDLGKVFDTLIEQTRRDLSSGQMTAGPSVSG